jgi:peptide deformylase
MVREILVYPNPILRKKSSNIKVFDKELHTLLDDMNETLISSGGIGLAAVQIGVLKNVLLINLPVVDPKDSTKDIVFKKNLIEAINPKILFKDGEQLHQEGCLSIPGYYDDIKRAYNITVSYFKRNGEEINIQVNDFEAVAWQHEIEHLSGHVFIENLSFLKRKKFEKEWKRKLKEEKKLLKVLN